MLTTEESYTRMINDLLRYFSRDYNVSHLLHVGWQRIKDLSGWEVEVEIRHDIEGGFSESSI